MTGPRWTLVLRTKGGSIPCAAHQASMSRCTSKAAAAAASRRKKAPIPACPIALTTRGPSRCRDEDLPRAPTGRRGAGPARVPAGPGAQAERRPQLDLELALLGGAQVLLRRHVRHAQRAADAVHGVGRLADAGVDGEAQLHALVEVRVVR